MSLTVRPLLPVTGQRVELVFTPDPPLRLEEGKTYTIRLTPLSGFRCYSAGKSVDAAAFADFARGGRSRLNRVSFACRSGSPRKTNTASGFWTGMRRSAARAYTRSTRICTPRIPSRGICTIIPIYRTGGNRRPM